MSGVSPPSAGSPFSAAPAGFVSEEEGAPPEQGAASALLQVQLLLPMRRPWSSRFGDWPIFEGGYGVRKEGAWACYPHGLYWADALRPLWPWVATFDGGALGGSSHAWRSLVEFKMPEALIMGKRPILLRQSRLGTPQVLRKWSLLVLRPECRCRVLPVRCAAYLAPCVFVVSKHSHMFATARTFCRNSHCA